MQTTLSQPFNADNFAHIYQHIFTNAKLKQEDDGKKVTQCFLIKDLFQNEL